MRHLLPRRGQRVEVRPLGRPDRRYASVVEEVRPPVVVLAPPMEQEHLVPVAAGQPLELCYSDGRGDMRLLAVALDRSRPGRPVLVESLDVFQLQRRRYFRWEGQYPVRFAVVDSAAKTGRAGQPPAEPEWRATETFDLSAGGLSLRWDEELAGGTPLWIEVDLAGVRARAEGRVVRSWPNGDGGPGRYRVGVEFTSITEGNQARIMRFIFSQEVGRRRRR